MIFLYLSPLQEGQACQATNDCEPPLTCQKGGCSYRQSEGGACASSADCLPQLVCVAGLCILRGQKGTPCKPTIQFCDGTKGLRCDSGGTCTQAVRNPLDGDCSENPPLILCKEGLLCVGMVGTSPGACSYPLPEGSACDVNFPACAPPAVCQGGICKLVPTCMFK